jgi:branched-chain amino acid transport system ATP-binding protein
MAELLTLEQVSAGYGQSRVLEGVDLTLGSGDSLALLGRNGVGKSTLIMTLMGLTRQHQGRIEFMGRDLAHGTWLGAAGAPHLRLAHRASKS